MNAHDFTDFWHHHNPHSLFYPTANQPPAQSLQALSTRTVTELNPSEGLDPQLQPANPHCNETLGQFLNGQANTQLDNVQQLHANEQTDQQQANQHHQQQQLQPHTLVDLSRVGNHNVGNPPFQMPTLTSPLMDLATHGPQAAQLLAAGFSSGFGGFAHSAAQFIPFNLHAMAASGVGPPRLHSPPVSANAPTIFDLDQQQACRSTQQINQQNIHANLAKMSPEKMSQMSPKNQQADEMPPPLQLMNNIGNTNDQPETKPTLIPTLKQERHPVAQIPTAVVEPKVELLGNAPLCQVCQSGPSNGLHFGAPRTCVQSVTPKSMFANAHNVAHFESQIGYRKICRNCRMKRCLEIGMMPEKVQHKRHRREVLGLEAFNTSPLIGSQQKIHQLQQVINTKLERPPPAQSTNGNANNELAHLSNLQAQQLGEDLMARQHYAANQMAALSSNPWALGPLQNCVQQL
ncbi:Nuclear receptor domain-containing protein [Aphelenchoides bicaudatus]|nr:Nuclear receptor domain-containing protein [Aphelenchoides bicaudatus]